ncbi:hypothetical protein [Leptospira wolffii]|uniref:hypothetical protein n=1 Tax=Leptospira wolffii TaxID=409998 RepID=UPI0003088114|nr:hypothetical protein [Leptospira wolffii]EPG64543.1 hypothetical protein LEP1GSC061_3742 [Leptospira wolffii serovar Khorat str. Khorat-H2]
MKSKFLNLIVPGLILFGHIFLSATEFPILSVDRYWQMPSKDCFYSAPFDAFLYTHGSSPFLGMVHYAATVLGGGNPNLVYSIILPLLHLISFLLMRKTFRLFRFRGSGLLLGILFLNPAVFAYFRYPFYSTYLFFISSLLIYLLWAPGNRILRYLLISFLICLASFIRPSWHIGLALIWILFLCYKERKRLSKKVLITGILFLALPVGLYLKNYILFDSFVGSTWLGMNIARTYNIKPSPTNITAISPFSSLDKYSGKYDEQDPLIEKYSNNPCVNGNDFQNVRYIVISREYQKWISPNINFKTSLLAFLIGLIIFLKSPTNYLFFKPRLLTLPELWKKSQGLDWLSFPLRNDLEINLYQFVYLFAMFYFFVRFRKITPRFKLIYLHVFFLGVLYCVVDPMESNRMRFEIEPFLYLLSAISLYSLAHRLKKWKKKRPEKKAA